MSAIFGRIGMIHDVAILGMARVFEVGIVAAALLPHVPQNEVGGARIYFGSNAKTGRAHPGCPHIIAPLAVEAGKIEPTARSECGIFPKGLNAAAAEYDLVTQLFTQFKTTDLGCFLADEYSHFFVLREIAELVDADPGGLGREQTRQQTNPNTKKKNIFH